MYMRCAIFTMLGAMFVCATGARAQDIEVSEFPSADGVRIVGNNPNSVPSQTAMPAGDFNGDGYDDLLFGSPLQNPDSGAYVVFGNAELDTDVSMLPFISAATPAGFRMYDADASLGFEVSPAGDFNNDGFDDILIMSWSGIAYLVYGHGGPASNINLPQPSDSVVKFTSAGNYGAGVGDFNGDGFDDIVLGKPNFAPIYYAGNAGRVWVILGRANLTGEVDLNNFQASDQNGFTVTGRSGSNLGGSVYAIGDFNGDGLSDFAVAARSGQPTELWASRMIFMGKDSGFQDIDFSAQPDPYYLPTGCVIIRNGTVGSGYTYTTGSAADTMMDFNGDGKSDILIGGIGYVPTDTYKNFIVYGRDDATTTILLSDIAAGTTGGLQILSPPGESAGESNGWAGDLNNDGFSDIALVARHATHNAIPGSGTAYVIWGGKQTTGTMNLAQFTTERDGFMVNGELEGTEAYGFSVSPAGNVNGDSYDDFMLFVTDYNQDIHNSFGLNYIIFGRPSAARVSGWELWEK